MLMVINIRHFFPPFLESMKLSCLEFLPMTF